MKRGGGGRGGGILGETNDASYPDAVVDVANFCFADHQIKIIQFQQYDKECSDSYCCCFFFFLSYLKLL